jgi:FKBP-type peptidyl-prolyl cis-trans isomerase (trigger factor)
MAPSFLRSIGTTGADGQVGAETSKNLVVGGTRLVNEFVREMVGVDDGHTHFLQLTANQRFSAADRAGDADYVGFLLAIFRDACHREPFPVWI